MNRTQAEPTGRVNWPAFLRQHDLHFDSLPGCWQEAPHFGNAMIGSMLYAPGGELRLEIFRADVCDHRDESYGWTAYSRPHFRIGYFALETVGKATGCEWRLDLWNAELTGTLRTDRGEVQVRHFVHADDMVIVTELTPSQGERDLGWTWHPEEARTTRGGYPSNPEELDAFAKRYGEAYRQTLKPNAPNPAGRLQSCDPESRGDEVGGLAERPAPGLPPPACGGLGNRARPTGVSVWIQDLLAGGQYATAWAEAREGDTRTHFATIANRYPLADAERTAVDDIRRCLTSDRDEWMASHRGWWHEYYPRSFVAVPDRSLASLYWQSIYRLGCCSRAGRYYVDTSGLWFQGGPWPYTTHDWNTQAAHWGVYAANRLEQGEELVNRLRRYQRNLADAVHPVAWRDDSAYLPLATAGDLAGTRQSDRRYYDCVGCLPWLLHNAWWQYRFSMDDGVLRETVYPLLRRAVNLYLHLAHADADGTLHLAPTYSPETETCQDANFDLALFKWGCHTLLQACKRLRIDDPLMPRWREVVDRLVEFPVNEDGFMLGAGRAPWDNHRHLSHLLMIYPLHLVNIEQDGAREVLKRSCDAAHRSVGSDAGRDSGHLHAMVQTHAGPIASAIGDGDRALAGLKRLQAELHPNGLWSCGHNPCIESTLSLVNNIQEMLIQSWSDPASDCAGPIRIFPAMPSAWQDVEFHDLRAEGAFLVSAQRCGGQTQWVRIRSLAGEPCRVKLAVEGALRREGRPDQPLPERSPGVYDIELKKDEEVVLRPGSRRASG